jgi:redox-sensitive bicupin YhaK (pirin superfamily)
MCEPRYRDWQEDEIPVMMLNQGKVVVKVIAGETGGVESVKELAYAKAWYLDVEVQPGRF